MTLASRNHVFFDLDGTLVDTRAAVVECYTRVFRTCLNSDFPSPGLPMADLFAMRPPELFRFVAPERVEELHAAYRAAYPQCTAHIKVFDGIRDMVMALVSSGRKVGLVTNKGLERTLIDLTVAGLAPESFTTIVTAEDTEERKPHPAPILLGLERAGASAGEAAYVGDGPQDILAARAAGMPVIAVSYGFYEEALLASHAPDALVASPAELSRVLGIGQAQTAGAKQ